MEAIRAFRLALAEGEATDVRAVPGGIAVSNSRVPDSYAQNMYWIGEPVSVPPLEPPYWWAEYHDAPPPVDGHPVEENVVMLFAGAASGSSARVLPPGAIRDAIVAEWRENLPGAPDDVYAQLADRQLETARACELTNHVSFADTRPAGWCELRTLTVGGRRVAQVEAVVALREFRGRGHATAAVQSALAAAAGADVVFLVADADDWPRQWYARLGFADVAPSWTVGRPRD